MVKVKIITICIIIGICSSFVSCKNQQTVKDNNKESNTRKIENQTGYLTGEIQWQYINVHDVLYENSTEYLEKLTENCQFYGNVKECLTTEFPTNDLQSCHIAEGTNVYINVLDSSIVYIEDKKIKQYRIFKLVD